jgi:hypothetical protein
VLVFSGGHPFEMAEPLAIQQARQGKITLKSVDHGPRR